MDELEKIAQIPSTGDDVLRRYRYQHLYTILLSIQMYKKEIPYKKLFCELADDVLGILDNNKFASIQIKTSESKLAFSYNDDEVTKSIGRFISLNITFPELFQEFLFVSNIGFKKNLDLMKIIDDIKTNPIKLDPKFREYIKKLSKENSVTPQDVRNVLKKIQIQKSPPLNEIASKIITDYIAKLDNCKSLSVPRLNSLLNIFELEVSQKSSKVIKNSLSDYIVFVKNGEEEQLKNEIESKQILPDLIDKMTKDSSITYLVSNKPAKFELKPGSVKLMEQKMAAGGIGLLEIDSMKNLSLSANSYFFEEFNKRNGESEEIQKEIDHLETLLKNEAAESETESKKNYTLYGSDMLKNLEHRLKAISENQSNDVFGIKYPLLKGIIGILTGDCKIWFNDGRMK